MKKKIFFIIITVLFVSITTYAGDEESKCLKICKAYQAINNMTGVQKWKALEKLLIKLKEFSTPPNDFFSILNDGTIEYHEYRVKDIKKKRVGKMQIDYKKGYIIIPYIRNQKFYSFNIECDQFIEDECVIQINFYIYPKYNEPDEGENILGSEKYLVIAADIPNK